MTKPSADGINSRENVFSILKDITKRCTETISASAHRFFTFIVLIKAVPLSEDLRNFHSH